MSGTEERQEASKGLDAMHPVAALALLAKGQQAAARAVDAVLDEIAAAAALVADSLSSDGRLIYIGAGSSGLMALVDGLELHGTYGIAEDKVIILMAGGAESLKTLKGGPEDDRDLGRKDCLAAGIGAGDCVIALSASGSTPYVLAAAEEARARGARIVAIASNGAVPLFALADVAIHLDTPPELVAGSTRMGAGTAQKITLNMISTLACMQLGHVLDGHMVNLRADNAKLHARAARMVSEIAGIAVPDAEALLAQAGGSVKLAVLLAAGAPDLAAAESRLTAAGQNLRHALAGLKETTGGA